MSNQRMSCWTGLRFGYVFANCHSINCRSNEYVKALTAGLGEFLDIVEDVLGLERYRRIKIMIDITKPIRRNQKMTDRSGKEVKVEFKYERLPYFCLACGIIRHSERDCLNVSEEDKKKELGWSLSLRETPRKGYSKDIEEITLITKSRRQLFVTKEHEAPRSITTVVIPKEVEEGVKGSLVEEIQEIGIMGEGKLVVGKEGLGMVSLVSTRANREVEGEKVTGVTVENPGNVGGEIISVGEGGREDVV